MNVKILVDDLPASCYLCPLSYLSIITKGLTCPVTKNNVEDKGYTSRDKDCILSKRAIESEAPFKVYIGDFPKTSMSYCNSDSEPE